VPVRLKRSQIALFVDFNNPRLYFFRDQRGLEVDFIVPSGEQELVLIEAKASRTVYPDTARSMLSLAQNISNHRTRCIVVHATTVQDEDDTALACGDDLLSIHFFVLARSTSGESSQSGPFRVLTATASVSSGTGRH
jgi:hypothetical protein